MSKMRLVGLVGLVMVVLGAVVIVLGFHDFATAEDHEGTPAGWYLLPVGGLLALVGLGVVGRSAEHGSTEPFTDEELERGRRERRGDD